MAIKENRFTRICTTLLIASFIGGITIESAVACTRAMYVGPGDVVVTGRSMDWWTTLDSNLWVLPKGIAQTGSAGPNSIKWVSKYGSAIVSGFEAATADGMNEKGLVANLLYLSNAQYGSVGNKPTLSVTQWAQYALDNFATVDEAVKTLKAEPFRIAAPVLPGGAAASLHLALSDSTGDSAIFEYIDGKLVIHHGKQYKVMTNEPSFDTQLAINSYWKSVGGTNFLPGTFTPSDRFARASFYIDTLPTKVDKSYSVNLPTKNLETQASFGVLGSIRAVSVPLGEGIPGKPNVASTVWRTVADQKSKIYYFDSATSPNTFWVDLKEFDLSPGAPVKKLNVAGGKIYSGNTSKLFEPAKLYTPLVATPK